MSDIGEHTASGLLYEGNFEEWFPRMTKILAHHYTCSKNIIIGRNSQPRNKMPQAFLRLFPGPGIQTMEKLSTIIWWQVSRSVRLRIKEQSQKDPVDLMNTLRDVARPFKLMDLPAEVRLEVYSYLMQPRMQVVSLGSFHHNRRVPEPPVTRISRQVRAEAMPIFHKGTHEFLLLNCNKVRPRRTLSPETQGLPCVGISCATLINDWAKTLSQDRLRYLRHVTIHLQLERFIFHGKSLRVSIVIAKGRLELKFAGNMWLDLGSQKMLTDHAASISNLGQALRLEGEAIIMFLTSQPSIWDQLRLRPK